MSSRSEGKSFIGSTKDNKLMEETSRLHVVTSTSKPNSKRYVKALNEHKAYQAAQIAAIAPPYSRLSNSAKLHGGRIRLWRYPCPKCMSWSDGKHVAMKSMANIGKDVALPR